MTQQPYHINVLYIPGGYGWEIIVKDMVIAANSHHPFDYPRDAYDAARWWTWQHEQLGHEFRPNWWEPKEEDKEPRCPTCGQEMER